MVSFRILALRSETFGPLFSLGDAELEARHARRCVVDAKPGYPCRVSLTDADLGETVLALFYTHHASKSPYRGSGPIFVREHVRQAHCEVDEVPDFLRRRLLSARAYSAEGLLLHAKVVVGREVRPTLRAFFANEAIVYVHLHNAGPGCYLCRAERASPGVTQDLADGADAGTPY